MNSARWAIHHSVLVNLSVALIIVAGTYCFLTLPREIFPNFSKNEILVQSTFPGASPEEVELLVTAEIENAIAELEEIDKVTSESFEGNSRVVVKLIGTAEMARSLDRIKAAVDAIDDLPEELDPPVVTEVASRFPVIVVSVHGQLDPSVMKEIADDLADELRALPGASQVSLSGIPETVIWIDVDPLRLVEFELSISDVEAAVRGRNLNAPGGTLRTPRGEILVRTTGEVAQPEELLAIPLRQGLEGRTLTLGRVASVREGFEEPPDTLGFMDGQRAINLTVFKDESGDAIEIAGLVNDYCAELRERLPAGVNVKTHTDLSIYVQNRIRTMNSTAVLALSLVFACLYLFLSGRIAFLAGLGLPVGFLGAALFLQLIGESLNMVAMFAFIIVIGMVVDDAIVLCENVFRHLENGKSPTRAAIDGTREVAAPVLCTVATTVAAFLPMLLLSGDIGKYMRVIPVVVCITLAFSLYEALFALPVHITEVMSLTRGRPLGQAALAGTLDSVGRMYRRMIGPLLMNRYLCLVVLFCTSLILAAYGFKSIPFELFGEIESKQFFINLEAAPSTGIYEMARRVSAVEKLVAELPDEELESQHTNVGVSFQDVSSFRIGSHLAQVYVDLREGEGRRRDSETIINDLRAKIRRLDGFRSMRILRPEAGPQVPAIEIEVVGQDLEDLASVAEVLTGELGQIDGVEDLRDDLDAGKEELRVRLKPQGEALGLRLSDIATVVRNRFYGAEASRLHRTDEAPEIRARLPANWRDRAFDVVHSWVQLPGGPRVYLDDVLEVERDRGPARITRTNRKRTVTVAADVNRKKANPTDVLDSLTPTVNQLQASHPGVRVDVAGEARDLNRTLTELALAAIIAGGVIYLLLAALFRSYLQPLIVLAVIPFATDGVLIGHLVQGHNLSVLSFLGLLALIGIVVNDSLVLVSFINDARGRGLDVLSAVEEGGAMRVRPILLTSITTIAGLVPLAFFSTGQAKFLAPMAISIVWGLTTATALTLIVVPCLFLVYEDFRRMVRRLFRLPAHSDAVSSSRP